MSDLIERQEVIEIINELSREHFTTQDYFQVYLDALKDIEMKVKFLPSAEIDLKPCPICGSKSALVEKKIYGVSCCNYNCDKTFIEFYESKEEAIEMWNNGEEEK